ncbi:MAG: methyltransferase [Pelagibacteraceae bacterium]|jgi:hypothetical protein|nr:methyltransferase [Pelagibacteraceae bacterium]MDP6710480.1 methyltransferase [Pelagibacteraceae bacterium]|tara:strand:- start:701 stop:1366 length:666 start_codon:yes stop_codon:yes gene_type:complete
MIENKLNFFFKNQIWHFGGTIVLFYIGVQFVDLESNINTFLGIRTSGWFMIAMSIPLIHQAYVWICWRSELCWKLISNTIGFKGYVIFFFILIISRLSVIVLCFVDYGSLYKPGWLAWLLGLILFIPGAYTMYSVKKYFGFLRAAGADHFDTKYRDLPFENRGIFKWTPNAMYVFAIGIPFSFAVATGSQSMFIVAIYTYISIWLHYFCTEKPDFAVIYNN